MNGCITFCAYRKCPNTDCLRFHENAPKEKSCSWFAVRPRDNGACDYYLKNEIKEKNAK